MKKKILSALCLLLMVCAFLQPHRVHALTPLEPERPSSLTLYYTQDGQAFPDLDIRIYRVAEAHPDGTFDLLEPFSEYPVNIHGITSQKEWQDVSSTLRTYITADQVAPTRVATTNEEGTAIFSDLKTGLYLVCGVLAENETGIYRFNDFMVYLPTPLEEGDFDYDMEAKPKCTQFVPKKAYSVVKLWKDAGNEGSRPKSVTVDILKDGVVYDTVVLSADNNWSYVWSVPEDGSLWSVLEKNVPDDYKVTISENAAGFTITNTKPTHEDPPKTGDMTTLWHFAVCLCVSGFGLVLMGLWRGRKS